MQVMQFSEQDFERSGAALGVPVTFLKAINSVEAAGSGFLPDGRVKVQYEPHVMYQRLTKRFGKARADTELAAHPDLVALKPGSYQPADKEDRDMNRAAQVIDRACALESASWGAFQIMGYHWKDIGFDTLQDFVNTQYSASGQMDTLVRFLKANKPILSALRAGEWSTFARLYNGPAYAQNQYDTKLAAAVKKFGG